MSSSIESNSTESHVILVGGVAPWLFVYMYFCLFTFLSTSRGSRYDSTAFLS